MKQKRSNLVISGMLKVEELTKEQLITEYNRLRTESDAEVTSLRGKIDILHAKLEAHNSYEFTCFDHSLRYRLAWQYFT